MWKNRIALALACALLLGAQAPAPGDSITVTGEKEKAAINGFIKSLAVPNRLTGKLARWETGICPTAAGLRNEAIGFITQRLKDVAAQVGAPVDKSPSCKPNIHIVFTTKPQALLDGMRKDHPGFLGYHDNKEQLAKLATVTRPIQAWYTTATLDLRGKMEIDSAKPGMGLEIWLPCSRIPPGVCRVDLPYASTAAVSGSRLGDGLRSTFHNVIVVADPTKLEELEMGPLSDYIALLALSQVQALDQCQTLPSIANLLPSGCEREAGMTPADMGYLRGLYHMNPEQAMAGQQDFVAYQMEQALTGH